MAYYWYALWVKPHKERVVARQLTVRDIDYFLPLVKVNPVNPRSAKERPYFPCYMFIYLDLDAVGANTLNWLPGARGLVTSGDEPTPVPQDLIDRLERTIVDIEKQGGLLKNGLEQGDDIRITDGPFKDYKGIFDMRLSGNQRVQVLLNYLNESKMRVKIDISQIEKVVGGASS